MVMIAVKDVTTTQHEEIAHHQQQEASATAISADEYKRIKTITKTLALSLI